MERILLLWDDLDDLAGAARHAAITAADGLIHGGRDALTHVGGWLGAGGLASARVEPTTEP